MLITAPSLPAFKQGVGMTRKRGTCVLVGLPPGAFPLEIFGLVAGASPCGARSSVRARIWPNASISRPNGKVKADIELQPLSSINAIFERLEHGDVPSRVVLDF